MNNTTSSIITIGREYGSAGRQIGQEVARYFGIKCYDKELAPINFAGEAFCFTGEFALGSREVEPHALGDGVGEAVATGAIAQVEVEGGEAGALARDVEAVGQAVGA